MPAPPTTAIAPPRLRSLSRRRDLPGVSRLALHAATLGTTAALIGATLGTPALPFALWVHGTVLVFLFAPLHECIHRTAFRSRWLNHTLAHVAGLILVLPPRYFRAFHLAHHRHTRDRARDPELAGAQPATWRAYFLHVSGLPYWCERIATTVRHAAGRVPEPFVARAARAGITREARTYLCLYATLALLGTSPAGPWLVWYWLLPALLGQPALRLFLLAEHGGCHDSDAVFDNTRTTRSNTLVRLLAWNMPYHAEHHAAASVPFHALPALHALIGRRVRFRARGYWQVNRELARRLGRV